MATTGDPSLLTAHAAGHVTITAGMGAADITVYDPTTYPNYTLPIGAVLWRRCRPANLDVGRR